MNIATDYPSAWLDSRSIRVASDITLGCVLLAVGAVAILSAPAAISFSESEGLDANFFPTVLGWLVLAAAIFLLVRGAIFGGGRPARWSLTGLAIIAAAIIAFFAAGVAWGFGLLLMFGPAEYATLIVLGLTVSVALARRSRVQAAAMALLGLLLATVGLDTITGDPRLTLGLDQLLEGFTSPIMCLGLFVVADGVLCLASPALWLATYARLVDGWAAPRIPSMAAMGMRAAAALAIAAACYLAFAFEGRTWDIGLLLPFGAFGLASKLFGWNRFVLFVAFVYSTLLEESIRQSMLLSNGDPGVFLAHPISTTLLLLAGCTLALAALLSARRAISRRNERAVAGAS